jgi:uncharacterized protein YbgA (DUF1722 family)/uncharacterized protein YbbK (DUF523 family)
MMSTEPRIRLGISACLLGQKVRYDGGHKLDSFLAHTLGPYVEYVPICPEVECGLGVPREAMHLEGNPAEPRLVTVRTKLDMTKQMLDWAEKRVRELKKENICGFIFKSDSPSSGMERVRIYNEKGMLSAKGRGLFAGAFMDHFPTLPVEEEGRLNDVGLRENFIERIFVYARLKETISEGMTAARLIDFHTRHKLLMLAHSPKHYSLMGRLVAAGPQQLMETTFKQYESLLMEGLKLRATAKKNSNVLYHIAGYFKRVLSADERQELVHIIDLYARQSIPLIVPVTLMNHYVRTFNEPYLKEQVYLNPHPLELTLRNHA